MDGDGADKGIRDFNQLLYGGEVAGFEVSLHIPNADDVIPVRYIMDEMMPVAEVSDELWSRVINVNLTAPFVLSRRAVQQMLKQG